jgi:hypothetical protein
MGWDDHRLHAAPILPAGNRLECVGSARECHHSRGPLAVALTIRRRPRAFHKANQCTPNQKCRAERLPSSPTQRVVWWRDQSSPSDFRGQINSTHPKQNSRSVF